MRVRTTTATPTQRPATRDACRRADEADPLLPDRDLFALPEGVIYLDGNSLGARPVSAARRAAEVVDEWGEGLVRSWNTAGWHGLPERLGSLVTEILGGWSGTTVVTDSTSVNLFKALAAAVDLQRRSDPRRRVIVTERDNFPTDVYIAQGLAGFLGADIEVRLVDEHLSLEDALDDEVCVLSLSHVNYRTGAMWDMAATTALAHEYGVLTVWDLAHSAGAVPLDISAAGADFAVGCTYKYLNGGPGAPAFIWVDRRHAARARQPLTGWWGHEQPFAMTDSFSPAAGIRRFLCGTQPITSLAVAECGLEIMAGTDQIELRRKSLALTDLFIELVETRCADHPLELITPRDHDRRGSHVSFTHPEGFAVMQALIDRGVIGDYREPGVLRFGITPLYLDHTDVWDAVEALRDVLDSRAWDTATYRRRHAVT